MSSPCKKIKLNSKKDQVASEPTPRYTQESKVTSTPQRRSKRSISPNISRISSSSTFGTALTESFNEEVNEETVFDSSNEATNVQVSRLGSPFSSESDTSGIFAVEDYDAYINDCRKIKYGGKLWKSCKPLHDNTLYAEILQTPRNVEDIVTELILSYNSNREQVIHKLLQFCGDVSGFQNFEVAKNYNFQENSSKRVIEIMESQNTLAKQEVLKNTGNYLLNDTNSNLGKFLKVAIFNFLQKLIIHVHNRGILYEPFFAKHFFEFIKCMASSGIRPIRHTGVIFGIKILTAIVMVFNKIIDEENSSSDQSSENIHLEQKQEINHYLEYFYIIFYKNCRLQDKKTSTMRVECIYEISIWIRYFPKIFINQLQTVNYLMKLLTDMSKNVRYAALQICEVLVETTDLLKFLKNVPNFSECIGKRFFDVDIKVAVKAIDIYKLFLKYDDSFITIDQFKILMDLVYDKYFLVREAACQFLVLFLRKTEENQENLLLRLTEFSMKPRKSTVQFLVEGCLNHFSVIKNWDLYVNILLVNNAEFEVKEYVVKIFAEAVHQVLVGEPSVVRNSSRKAQPVDPSEHDKVVKYIPILQTLMEHYQDCPTILAEFLKIVVAIKDDVLNEVPFKTIKNICSQLEKLFNYCDDEIVLKKLSETFHYFSDLATHGGYVHKLIEIISSKYINNFMENGSIRNQSATDILKVSILFEYFNLTHKLQWESLFGFWENNETTIGHLLICCKWYLIWSLRNLKAIENPLSDFPILLRSCNEFTGSCFEMLQKLKGQQLHFKSYECLCDFHIKYMKDLGELSKFVKRLEDLKLVIDDKPTQDILVSFLQKYVINNTAVPLNERKSYIRKYIELVHFNVLPIESLANVFKYYYVFNKEYGPVIHSSLLAITKYDETIFLMVIMYTLTVVYENIMDKYNVVDMMSQEAKDLKCLIRQFLTSEKFKSSEKNIIKLVYFAINYVFRDETKIPFLYFIRYFVDMIDQNEHKKEVLEFFKTKVPKAAEKNDAVLYFGNFLKAQKPKRTGKKENVEPQKKVEKSIKTGPAKGSAKKTGAPHKKNASRKVKKNKKADSETDEPEDDLTIHDSESDDLQE